MERRYRVFDTEEEDIYVAVDSHYLKITDAKQSYIQSKTTDRKDDSIMIQVAKRHATGVDAVLTFGVEEGERFAMALLNLCNSIKY